MKESKLRSVIREEISDLLRESDAKEKLGRIQGRKRRELEDNLKQVRRKLKEAEEALVEFRDSTPRDVRGVWQEVDQEIMLPIQKAENRLGGYIFVLEGR